MNAQLMAARGLQSIVDAPVWVMLLLKVTALLLAAWAVHVALRRLNPRWRVLLWRVTAVGLVALPAVAWLLPAVEIPVESPPTEETAWVARQESSMGVGEVPEQPETPFPLLDSATPMATPATPFAEPQSVPPSTQRVTPPPSEPSWFTWRQVLLAVWLGGMAVLAFRWSIGHYRIAQLVGRAEQPPQWIGSECLRAAQAVGCRSRVRVMQSALVQSPLLCGLRRPVLLLPPRMCEDSYRRDLPAILAHELTHVRFRDLLWNAALHLISIVLWFHPLAWRLRKAHLAACERVCDAVSANFVGSVTDYCRTLARVAVESVVLPSPAGIAMARASNVSRRLNSLKRRVFHASLRRRSVVGFSLAASLGVAVVGALQFALAEPLPEDIVAVADKEPEAQSAEKKPQPATSEGQPTASANPAQKTNLLRVRVVEESGKPLAGTKLKAAFLGHKTDYITDAEGRATVVVPAPNGKFLSLIAYPDGYPPVRKWWRNDAGNELIPSEFTFTYEEGRTIGGIVRNEDGRPIPGAKVFLSISCPKYEEPANCLALWDSTFLTDFNGRWHLDHVPQPIGRVLIGLQHPNYISVPGPGEVSAAEQQRIKQGTAIMVMKKGIPVSGTVTDPEGKPVGAARVLLGEWYSPPRIETSTDQQGHYRFASLAPGERRGTDLTVVKPGLAPGLRNINIQSRMKPVDFQLEKGNTLRVRVVGKDGKPIAGVFVTPDTWRGKRVLCDLEIRGRTDAEGRWAWTWAPKDAVLTDFGLTGRINYISIRHRPLVAQEAEHVVTLDPALTISGRVIDAETKQLVPSFRIVRGCMSTGSAEQIMWDRLEVREGKNGQYEQMISQSSRVHLLRIEADGYQPAVSREFKDNEGNVTYDFSLSKGQSLNVLVRMPDGKPAAGAEVVLCPEEPGKFINMALFVKSGRFPYPDPTRPFMKTGPDGRVSIAPQGQRYLFVVLHDQGIAQGTSEELAANATITLTGWARLEGTVRRGTKPVPGAKVDVYPLESLGPKWGFLNFQEQAEADASGKFVFAKLKPGKWCVRELPAEPGRMVGPSQHQKNVELAPAQALSVMLGGTGRPVVGRIKWPGDKPPQGDLSRIGADLRPKLPEMPPPPKATRDQGPDAVRASMKQWMESEEGKAWQKKAQQRTECPRMVSVSREGVLRIDDAVQGEFELGVYVMLKDQIMPWERPELLRYACDFSIPEIPGGVSDQPLDLGNVAIEDKSPKKLPSDPVKPPAPRPPGTKSIDGLRDHFDLLRYVVATYKENKQKIQTWQGRATVEESTVYHRGMMGHEYSAKVQFAFDRARKSLRWNTTLDKWTRSREGVKTPQPVPQISNGMITPEAVYRVGSFGSPVNPDRRPLTLTIWSPDDPSDGRLQPQLYDFNPLFYIETPRGDVARDLSVYLGWIDHPGLGGTKVIRDGDQVTIDMGTNDSFNRVSLSLTQGCNPISYESAGSPGSTWQYRGTYELRDGVWLPKTWIETVRAKDSHDTDRKVTFVENIVNQPVEPAVFSFSRLGLQRGDNVDDRRTGQKYQYTGE